MTRGTRRGRAWLLLGGVLVMCGLALGTYNLVQSNRAADASARILAELGEAVGSEEPDDNSAARADTLRSGMPAYESFPGIEMPTVEIDGYRYIGTLEIPSVDLKLPVMQTWDADRLKVAPCRYAGSVYQDNMVIAAHNYASHFGKLFSIETGDEVFFTDADGNRFAYRVLDIEIVDPYDIDEMTSATGWDLTLFTCTYGGQTRYTVRCAHI